MHKMCDLMADVCLENGFVRVCYTGNPKTLLVYFIGISGTAPKVHNFVHRASSGLEGCEGKLSASENEPLF